MRALSSFPPVFQELTELCLRVLEHRQRNNAPLDKPLHRTKLRTEGQCVNTQMQLRQYWKALVAAEERGDLLSDPRGEWADRVCELAVRFVPGDKCALEIIHRNQLATAIDIASSLDALRASLPPEAARPPALPTTDIPQQPILPLPSITRATSAKAMDELIRSAYEAPATTPKTTK